MATILIAGCGDLGCRLGQTLSDKGHTIFGLRRQISALPNCIQGISHDLSVPPEQNSAPLVLPANIDMVYYILSANSFNDLAYQQAYVLGVQNLLTALDDHQLKRLFFISSSSVFGQSQGEVVNEADDTLGASFSTQRLLEGEALIQASKHASTIIRFGGIYGPGRTRLIDLVNNGKAQCTEGIYSNRIHTEDCVGVMKHLGQQANPAPLYIAVDNQPTLTCKVYEWLATTLGVKKIEHIAPTANSRTLQSNKQLSNKRLRDSGYQFIYPSFKEGYSALLKELKP